MKLSEIKSHLSAAQAVNFLLPDGNFVPAHFHVTELGLVTKIFIDCGGTLRNEKVVNFQLWSARDFEHRLDPKKLLNIISLSENNLGLGDLEIEVEYQSDTIGKYSLDFHGTAFVLTKKQTACSANDQCGIPQEKLKQIFSESTNNKSCTTGSGCC